MWLHRKKEKDDPKMSASTSAASETDGKAQTVAVEKKTPQGGIRKKILQFSSRVHHGFGNGASGTEGLSAKEIQRLEEAKKRLFQNKSPSSDRTVLSLVDGNSSPLPELRTMDNFLTHSTALWSPTGSSSGSLPSTSAGTTAAEFSYGTPKEFNVPGLSLPALAAVNIDVRELVLHRNASGDFGFKIRRMQYPIDGHHSKDPNMGSAVVFAEPCEFRSGPPRPSDLIGGLLPGDQLLEVNNKPVQSMTRDELLEEVQNSGSEIRLKVRAVPELAEFCKGDAQVEGALLHFNHGKCNDAFNESISDDERYWLIHAHGYTLCKLLAERLPDGKAKICVADGGDSLENERTLVVDSSDIDRANPARLDKIGDLAGLKFLNETSFIHLLRQRFGSNLQYTFGGTQNLVYLNAVSDTTMDEMSAEKGNTSYQIGQQNLMKMFRGCKRSRMPAHIYALAQQVYRNIQVSNRNQSVIFTGISGSGKSSQLRDLLYYLCEVSGSKIISYNKLRLNLEILEAFGNCNTLYNPNASRFIQLISLGFDTSALLCSIKIHTGLLETSRLMSKQGERPFHIFEYLWYGATQALRDRLNFHLISEPFFGNRKKDDGVDTYAMKWSNFVESLTTIGFTQAQIDGIFDILAAIFHLKHAGATQGNASRSAFINAANAENAANLLGLQFEELSQAIFRGIAPGSSTGGPSANSSISNFSMSSRSQTGQEALDSFIQSLYAELFSILANMINKQLAGRSEGVSHINILDIPGGTFSDAWDKSTNTKPGGLNELVFNYVNEKVLELFYNTNFVEPAELYAREQVQVTLDKPMANPQPLVRMLDKKQQLLNCADLERRSAEPRGLLYILEEEATFPGSNDHSLFERLFVHFEQNRLIRRHPRNRLQFVLSHSLNTAPTTYSVEGWVKQAQATNAGFIVPQVLQASQRASISELWNGVTKGLSHSASQSLIKRRTTQCIQSAEMGRSLTGFFSNISYQLAQLAMTALANGHHSRGAGDVLNVSFVRQQMRSVLLIDSVRAHNRAYPERMPFRLFRRLFHCLVGDNVNSTLDESALDDRSQVQKILEKMEIFEHRYRLGISQILLRSDVLMELEEKRDLALSGLIGSFQSRCREYLARRWLAKRRVQEIAIKCIQRNARLHFRLKKWTWWNLYTRVTPLLSVVRTDEEQRQWRERLSQLEAANTELKSVRVRLEGQVEELEQLLKTECQNTQRLSLNMESEVTTRIHLENELRALKQQLTKVLARNDLKGKDN
ncbi:myosin head (motor domain) domain-containing protein [Ditylenchus destructor]|nr:myosin head (motor domain) domain-containing protein [Ditylenchus destructor]